MIKLIGLIATIFATIALCTGSIAFNLAQATTEFDKFNLGLSALALALFGMTLLFVARVDIRANGWNFIAVVMLSIGLMLALYEAGTYQGYLTNVDMQYSGNSKEQQLEDYKLKLANSKLDVLAVGKVDDLKAAEKLAKLNGIVSQKEEQAHKCKFWRIECKTKALSGSGELAAQIDSLNAQLAAKTSYVKAIDETQKTIAGSEGKDWKKTHPFYQNIASLFFGAQEYAVKAQALWRWFKAILVVAFAHFGFIFYVSKDEKYVGYAKKLMEEIKSTGVDAIGKHHNQPAFVHTKTHSDPILNRMINPVIAVSKSNTSDFDMSELSERTYAQRGHADFEPVKINKSFQEPKWIGAGIGLKLNPSHPEYERFLADEVSLDIKVNQNKKINHEKIDTIENAQIDTQNKKLSVSASAGRGFDDLEPVYRVLIDSLKDKSFFKSESTVGVNSIKRACKVGTAKAQVLVTMLKERGVDIKNTNS